MVKNTCFKYQLPVVDDYCRVWLAGWMGTAGVRGWVLRGVRVSRREEGAHVWTDQPKTNHNPISIYFEISVLWTCENVPRPETIVPNVSLKSANTYSSCHFWKPPSPFKQALQDHCEMKHQLPCCKWQTYFHTNVKIFFEAVVLGVVG